MCGIVGATLPTKNVIKKQDINLLYLLAEERGGHACGFTNITKTVREPVKSPDFLTKLDIGETSHFIGHTRFKTFGANTADNAHPFEFDGLIGVHNGSIYNFEDLKKKYNQNFDVDSEFTYWMINEFGLKETLPQLRGWMAFAYYDKRDDNKLVLYRIAKPLFVGKKDGGVFYASLGDYLEAIGCEEVQEIDEHTIYKYKDGELVEKEKLGEKEKPVVQTKSYNGVQHSYEKNSYSKSANNNTTPNKDKYDLSRITTNVPWHAKSALQEDTGKIIFWWFSAADETVNVKIEDKYSITCYNIKNREDMKLGNDYPEIYDDVVDEYIKILTTKQRVARIVNGDIN